MNHYELLYIIPHTYPEERQGKIVSQIEALLKKEGGSITKTESLGKKKLTYPIRKIRFGFYNLVELDLESEKLKEINRQLRLVPEVLRFLMASKKKVVEKPIKPKKVKEIREMKIYKKEPKKEKPKKVSIEELDKKLDEILGDDIVKE